VRYALLIMTIPAALRGQDISSLNDTLKVSGGIDLRTVVYSGSGLAARRSPFSYAVGGNITFRKGEFSLPLAFMYSEQERSFSQPFNQFGIAPSYKNFTAYAGYQNLSWSSYTLAGHQILGGGLEYRKSKFTAGIMAGRLRRAAPFDSTVIQQQEPGYARNGIAFKLGYGSEENQLEYTLLRAADKTESLSFGGDSSQISAMPAENFANSLRGRLKLVKGLVLNGEAAASVYNRNRLEKPLEDVEMPGLLGTFFKPRISTQVYTAWNAGWNYQHRSFFLNGQMRRVAPDYMSMGAYFMENDVSSANAISGFSFMKNKASLSAGITRTTDNLQNKKPATTARLSPMANFTFNGLKQFGFDLNATDMYTSQKAGTEALPDSLKQQSSNPMIMFVPRWIKADTARVRTLMVSLMQQWLIDKNTSTTIATGYRNTNLNLNWSRTQIARFETWSLGLNLNALQASGVTTNTWGFNVGWNKGFKENKLPVNTMLGFSRTGINSRAVNLSAGTSYNVGSRHSFSGSANLMQQFFSSPGLNPIREITLIFTYRYSFGQ
jgi:hypothetical protein